MHRLIDWWPIVRFLARCLVRSGFPAFSRRVLGRTPPTTPPLGRRGASRLPCLRSSRGRCCSPALGRIRTTVWAPHSGSPLSGKPPVLPRDHGCPEPWPLRFRLARNVGLMPGISLAHPALAPKCLCHQKWKPHPKMFSPSPLFQFIASKICLPFSLSSAIRFFLFF